VATKARLRFDLRRRLGIAESGDGLAGHEALDGNIDEALDTLSGERHWPWLLHASNLVFGIGTGIAPVPVDFTVDVDLKINGLRARRVQLREFLDVSTRSAYVWTRRGTSILLSPANTQSLLGELWYYRQEPQLAIETQVPLMPAVHHHVIVSYAAYLTRSRQGRGDDAKEFLAEYDRALRSMRDDVSSGQRPPSLRHKGSESWASWV